MNNLATQKCIPCEGGMAALTAEACKMHLKQIPDWTLSADNKKLERKFAFKNYYETMAFVNAVAWMAHQQDHHPDLEVHYNNCLVRYNTHSIDGLSENDFICAAKVDLILSE